MSTIVMVVTVVVVVKPLVCAGAVVNMSMEVLYSVLAIGGRSGVAAVAEAID